MVQNRVQAPKDVATVVGMGEFDQIKVFLLYNKLAPNVLEVGKKLLTHVQTVMDKGINKLQKKYQ